MHSDETSIFTIYGTAETVHCCMLSQRTHKKSSLASQTPRDLTLFADHKVMPRKPIHSLLDLETRNSTGHIIMYRVTVTRYKKLRFLHVVSLP